MRPRLSGIFLFLITFVAGCGSQGTPPPPPTITSVGVSPTTASLLVKAPQQFTANVQGAGAFSPAVTWLVNNVPGGNSTVGTITSSGLYTAPSSVPSPNNVTVTGRVFGFDYRQPKHPRVISTAFYGDAILEFVSVFAFSGSNMFVGFGDRIFDVDITQSRNFIRHLCMPPPFGANATAAFPELQKKSFGTSVCNRKTHLKRDSTPRP